MLQLSQKTGEFWDETEPFGQSIIPSADLRLPTDVVPSFYRLKIKSNLENSRFTGDVYITIRASKRVKEIILHSKNLSINKNAKLTEQIYEKVESMHAKVKRQVHIEATNDSVPITDPIPANDTVATNTVVTNNTVATNNAVATNDTVPTNNTVPANDTVSNNNTVPTNVAQINNTFPNQNETKQTIGNENKTIDTFPGTVIPTTINPYLSVDTHTQVTHSSIRNIKILSISEATGDRLILTLATALKPDMDYTLELSFEGQISNSLTGFYKSSYTDKQNEVQ